MQPIRLTAEPLHLTLRHPFTISRGTTTTKVNMLVKATQGEWVGHGEGSFSTRYRQDGPLLEAETRKALAALDGSESSVEGMVARLDALSLLSGVRMGIHMALADLGARASGQPLHRWLEVPPPKPILTSFTIGLDSLEQVEAKTREAAGYPVLKVKAGRPDDVELVAAVRRLHSGPIRVDANEGWKVQEAPARIAAMAQLGVEFIEQPIRAGQYEALGSLAAGSPLPIYVDEDLVDGSELDRLVGRVAGINIKLMKCGGVDRAAAIAQRARRAGLKIMFGCMIESSLSITACCHLLGLADYTDLDGHLLLSDDPFEGVRVEGGLLSLSAAVSGIGAVAHTARPNNQVE